MGVGLVIGFVTGYTVRELGQYRNTVVVTDIHVIEQQSKDMYLMESKNHLPFTIKFCDDFVPQFEKNSLIKLIKYEQRSECVSVSGEKNGFIVARDSKGNPLRGVNYDGR